MAANEQRNGRVHEHGEEQQPRRVQDAAQAASGILGENIEALLEDRRRFDRQKRIGDRLADVLTSFSGSLGFVWVHLVLFAVWVLLNTGITGIEPWDPFPFELLGMIIGVEAFFLATFVLISQNRAAVISDRRADLDVQINLLSERELTHILRTLQSIADRLGIEPEEKEELEELAHHVEPSTILDAIAEKETGKPKGSIPG